MTPTLGAAQLVGASSGVLLDFDGPVTRLLPEPRNGELAEALRGPLRDAGLTLPEPVAQTIDHIVVLRYAGTCAPTLLAQVEAVSTEVETRAATGSHPTAGAHDFIAEAARSGRPVVIVTNNSADAVRTYLHRFHLGRHVRGVVGRDPRHPERMKPHPAMVGAALEILGETGDRCAIVGDTASDIQAGKAFGLRCIGLADTDERAGELVDARADAVVRSMLELLHGVAPT